MTTVPTDRETERLERTLADTRRDRDSYRIRYQSAVAEVHALSQRLSLIEDVQRVNFRPPKWTTRTGRTVKHHATVVSILSDTHWDEVVNPAEVGGINAYNRDIAIERLRAYTTGLVKTSRRYLAGVDYDGCVLMLGGDMFSGTLHDLAETNEDTSFGSLLFWSEHLAAVIGALVNEFGRIHVPVVVGNHGRQTRKPRTKLRARDNLDWLLAHIVAKHFDGDKRVTFDIPDSTDAIVPVYDTIHLLTHGDQVTGGAGIGGIWPPIMRLQARKRVRTPHDILVMGHFHQLIAAPQAGIIVNSSLKSYDEYAAVSNYKPEQPQQAAWLVTPEHGVSFSWPVIAPMHYAGPR